MLFSKVLLLRSLALQLQFAGVYQANDSGWQAPAPHRFERHARAQTRCANTARTHRPPAYRRAKHIQRPPAE